MSWTPLTGIEQDPIEEEERRTNAGRGLRDRGGYAVRKKHEDVMGCATSVEVEALRVKLESVQEEQQASNKEVLEYLVKLNKDVEETKKYLCGPEALSIDEIQVKNKSSSHSITEEELQLVKGSLKAIEKGVSLLLVKSYEQKTKVIERKHAGIKKLTEQISQELKSPDRRTPVKYIQEKLVEVEASLDKITDLTSPR